MKQYRLRMTSLAVLATLGATGSAMAAGIVASGGQTQVGTPGNTPVVNIAGADAAGISHNTFSSFDVDRNGVVFNNLTAAGVSQLAGQLAANANLNGTAAKVIVADVNSATASKLNGAMEVAGAPAHLMIANAAGISVNGATTINAPVLTLAAANFNPSAASPLGVMVDTSRATPATIDINGDGLDVGAGQLNLLSRATLVNAAVKGWTINSQNGTQFDGDASGNFTGKLTANAPHAPAVALDVSELGGMYANKIVLEGSEHGLGVNSAGIIQAGKGGLAIQMYGNPGTVNMTGGFIGGAGASYRVDSAEMANTPDSLRPEQYRGLDEAQIFALEKQESEALAAKSNARAGYSPAADAGLSDSEKVKLVADMAAQAQQQLADMHQPAAGHPNSGPDADEQAAREAQMDADRKAADAAYVADLERKAQEQAARDAQLEIDRQAWEAEQQRTAQEKAAAQAQAEAAYQAWLVEGQHKAEEQAASEKADREAQQAAQQAEQERVAQEQAARQAQMQADANAAAADMQRVASERTAHVTQMDAAFRALNEEQQRQAVERAARQANGIPDEAAWIADQQATAAGIAKIQQLEAQYRAAYNVVLDDRNAVAQGFVPTSIASQDVQRISYAAQAQPATLSVRYGY
ncbi:filamentous hemagglutinin N-terminal domain-containing protein [Paraburkholderia sp. BCC1884]|uniref:filamentous hemagglutinin N-terminal domain-containing protein n=1 Tax=Paraburkholderia sp. BCC1884 TaxID=2562668 RepID=UPI00118456D8|nr:filamentous hemagglutinin N-terminal domain-containing protein [Paraburkholderia sp. BCC1884]